MKNLLLSSMSLALVLGFVSCAKQSPKISGQNNLGLGNTTVTAPAGNNLLGEMPTEFTRKAVIEEVTGAWCGYCPNGAYAMDNACTANPDKVYGVAYHTGDVMSDLYDGLTSAAPDELYDRYGFGGVPSGIVNRKAGTDNLGAWGSATSSEIATPAECGLGIITKKVSGLTYNIEVHAGFSASLSGEYAVVAYVLEDEVHKGPAYDQKNFMDQDASSPWYGKGNPMSSSNFKHNHLLRQILFKGGIWGTTVTASSLKAGGKFVVKGEVDMSAEYDLNNVHILAMVVKRGSDASSDYIMNAQECKLGEIKKWD